MSDSSGSATTRLCFDSQGLLQRRRTQATASASRSDLLAWFTYSGGNLTAEQYAGGDEPALPLDFSDTCNSATPTAQYTVAHDYSNGVRSTSQYDGTTFKSLDLTVDASGQPTTSRDTAGVATTYEYDVLARPVKMKPADEAWTEYVYATYSSAAAPASVTVRQWPDNAEATGTPLTERRIYVDGSGRVLQVKTKMPDGWSTLRTRYDVLGQRVAVSTPEYRANADYEPDFTPAHETTFTYDTFGRPTSVTTPDDRVSTTAYTGTRQVARTVMIGGAANWNTLLAMPVVSERNVTTTETYDGHGRLISVAENTGTPTTTLYTYDYADRLTKVTQGAQVRNFTYDSRGLLLAEQHPEKGFAGSGWVDYARYDARGHAKERLEGSIKLTFAFDSAERLMKVYDTDANGTARLLKELTFGVSENENGKLKTARRYNRGDLGDVTVTEQYAYDGRGGRVSARTTTVDSATFAGATFTQAQTWDQLGNLETLTYPSTTLAPRPLTVTHGYTNGLLTSVDSFATMTWHANGLVNTITHPTTPRPVTERWVLDPSGMPRPKRIEVTDANQSFWSYGDYSYDGAGNIVAIGNATYQYDDVNRLSRYVTWTANKVYSATTYNYDRYGNRIGSFSDGCAANGRCFASLPSYLPIATSSNHHMALNYDDAGSVTSDGTYEFGYDATAMMTSLTRDDHRNERYLYTADDERIAVVRVIGAGRRTTWSIRDLGKRLLRTWTDDTTSGTRQFTWSEDDIWRGGSLLASDSPTGLKRYHLDRLGSPRLVTNGVGVRIGEQTFDPFGTGGTLDGGRLQFTSHERDIPESGTGLVLDYMHARYYDGAVGRFLSVDPGRDWNPKQPQSWNMYAYVRNNPMRYTDPTGKYVCRGDEAGCKTIETGIEKMREAAAAMKKSDPQRKKLQQVISAYGKAGDPTTRIKTVWVNPAKSNGAPLFTPGQTGQVGVNGLVAVSLINILEKAKGDSANAFTILGGTLTHEGWHHLQPGFTESRGPVSMLSHLHAEIRSYELAKRYYEALGKGALAPDPTKGAWRSTLEACDQAGGCVP